ncbi:MAG: hypothetical protein AAFR16_00585 [Pseudomonadota bacterium]
MRYAICLSMISIFVLALALAPNLIPKNGQAVAVFFPPWVEERQAINSVVAAGGRLLGFSGPHVVAIGGDNHFLHHLWRTDAWLIVNFEGLRAVCGPLAQDLPDVAFLGSQRG